MDGDNKTHIIISIFNGADNLPMIILVVVIVETIATMKIISE